MEGSQYPDHQERLESVLQRILSEAGNLLSLSFLHDYRQHSVITLSSELKKQTQKLFGAFLALGGSQREMEGEEVSGERGRRGEGDGMDVSEGERDGRGREEGEREGVNGGGREAKQRAIQRRVQEITKTVKDLKKEVHI